MTDKLNDKEFQDFLQVVKQHMQEQMEAVSAQLRDPGFIDQMLTQQQQEQFFTSCDRMLSQLVEAASTYRWKHADSVAPALFQRLRQEALSNGRKKLTLYFEEGPETIFGPSTLIGWQNSEGHKVWHGEVDELLERETHARGMAANALQDLALQIKDPEAKAGVLLAESAHRDQARRPVLFEKVLNSRSRLDIADAICADKEQRSGETGIAQMMKLMMAQQFEALRRELADQLTQEQQNITEKTLLEAAEASQSSTVVFFRGLLKRWKDRIS